LVISRPKPGDEVFIDEHPRPTDLYARNLAGVRELPHRAFIAFQERGGFFEVECLHTSSGSMYGASGASFPTLSNLSRFFFSV
jgi:hypothetical protein